MPALTRFRILAATLATLLAAPLLLAADGSVATHTPAVVPYILVGFVGGFKHYDNPHQALVQLAKREQSTLPQNSYVHVFENRHRRTAYNTIVRILDTDHDGVLSDREKSQARIILFGHSWGASATVLLARELSRIGIPVLLTVQVDSVAKPWQHDGVIPENVAAAVNFYQTDGMVHGRSRITAANDSKTQILGNYRVDYRKSPVKCGDISLFDRVTPTHAESACDPQLWSQVERLMHQQTDPNLAPVAALPLP